MWKAVDSEEKVASIVKLRNRCRGGVLCRSQRQKNPGMCRDSQPCDELGLLLGFAYCFTGPTASLRLLLRRLCALRAARRASARSSTNAADIDRRIAPTIVHISCDVHRFSDVRCQL